MLNKIHILGSSSDGCCYLLYFDNGIIQLDAGIKHKENSDRIFISHWHGDHIPSFEKKIGISIIEQAKQKLPIKKELTPNWFQTSDKELNISTNFYEFPHHYTKIGEDRKSIDRTFFYSIGLKFKHENETIGYFTDIGKWDVENQKINLSDCTWLFIECNWDYFLIKMGLIKPSPWAWYAFSSEGHMSNLDCLNAIAKWKVNKNCKIILLHKSGHHSDINNTYKMLDSIPNKKYIAKKGMIIYCKSGEII